MRTEPKASYRTVQYEYAYRYTPNTYRVVAYFIFDTNENEVVRDRNIVHSVHLTKHLLFS